MKVYTIYDTIAEVSGPAFVLYNHSAAARYFKQATEKFGEDAVQFELRYHGEVAEPGHPLDVWEILEENEKKQKLYREVSAFHNEEKE